MVFLDYDGPLASAMRLSRSEGWKGGQLLAHGLRNEPANEEGARDGVANGVATAWEVVRPSRARFEPCSDALGCARIGSMTLFGYSPK